MSVQSRRWWPSGFPVFLAKAMCGSLQVEEALSPLILIQTPEPNLTLTIEVSPTPIPEVSQHLTNLRKKLGRMQGLLMLAMAALTRTTRQGRRGSVACRRTCGAPRRD